MTTTPTQKDAEALAVLDREANEISLCGGAMFANELREARAHLASRIASLDAELAAVREDAERYRWMVSMMKLPLTPQLADVVSAFHASSKPILDAAIDTARGGRGGGGYGQD